MSDETFNELKESVQRIERGLFGDPKLQQRGVITTQREHERRLSRLERGVMYLAGGSGFAGVAWTIFTQWPRK